MSERTEGWTVRSWQRVRPRRRHGGDVTSAAVRRSDHGGALVAGAVRLQYGDTEFTWHDEHRRPQRSGVPRRGGGAWRTQPRLRDLSRVPAVRHAVHVVPDAVRDDRSPRRSRPRTHDPGRPGSGGRRMLPLRALCHRLSLTGTWHTGTGHAVARRAQRRLPAADAAGRSDAVRQPESSRRGPDRPPGCSVVPIGSAGSRRASHPSPTGSSVPSRARSSGGSSKPSPGSRRPDCCRCSPGNGSPRGSPAARR